MTAILNRRLYSVDEYYKMAEVGILKSMDKLELINGEIILKNPSNPKHSSYVMRLDALFSNTFGRKIIVSVKHPLRIDQHSEPEPDIAILKYREDYYTETHPSSEDVILLIEVSDSSVNVDKTIKLPLYAKSGIQEFWIINLKSNQIEVYKNPKGDSYKTKKIYKKEKSIKLEQLDALIDVSKIFF